MPWRLKSDMRHFVALTTGKPVVMGRKTYLSTAIKPLPRRTNIVVTRDRDFTAPGVVVVSSLEAGLETGRADALRRGADAVMVIGGADIYVAGHAVRRSARDHADPMPNRPVTRASRKSSHGVWQETSRTEHARGPSDDHAFATVQLRRRAADQQILVAQHAHAECSTCDWGSMSEAAQHVATRSRNHAETGGGAAHRHYSGARDRRAPPALPA